MARSPLFFNRRCLEGAALSNMDAAMARGGLARDDSALSPDDPMSGLRQEGAARDLTKRQAAEGKERMDDARTRGFHPVSFGSRRHGRGSRSQDRATRANEHHAPLLRCASLSRE